MHARVALTGTALLASLLGLGTPARAQGEREGGAEARPAAKHEPDEEKDGVRLRGGLSLAGGVFFLPANPMGGAASVAGRVGVQFNHYFALYYQNTPIVGATWEHDHRSGTVVAVDYNSLLANLTLFHALELGVGPSLDYVALAKGSLLATGLVPSVGTASGTGVAGGGHARVALVIGGLSGNGPRRSGLAIGVDAHPMFLGIGNALSLTIGLGAEWF